MGTTVGATGERGVGRSVAPEDRTPSSRRDVPIALCAAATAAVGVMVATRHGPGLTTDSTYYLSAGVALADGQGLTTFDGAPLVVFAPALSAVVGLGHVLGLDAQTTARTFNALMAGVAVWLGFVLLRRHLHDRSLVLGATILLAVSVPLLHAATWAMSEPAFVVVELGLILALERVWSVDRPPWTAFAVVVLAVWAGFLFRYAGLVGVAIAGITLLVGPATVSWSRRALRAIVVGAAAAVAPVVWMLRNRAVDGTLLANRYASPYGPVETVDHVLSTLGWWLAPGRATGGRARLVLGLVGLAVVVALLVLVLARRSAAPAERKAPLGPLGPLVVFVVGYLGYMVAAQLTTAISALDSRLLLPLYVPLVVLVALLLERARGALDDRSGRLVRMAAVVGVLVLVGQGALYVRDVRESALVGDGFNSEFWRRSEVARSGDAVPPGVTIVSNNAHAIWSATGRTRLAFAPTVDDVRNEVDAMTDERYVEAACRGAYLVWFDSPSLAMYDFPVDRLPATVARTEVARLRDGTVYRLSAADPATCPV